ncbi:MAG: hypothetical protein EOM45_12015 [Clostridia bacterium]|nr:hypothetical protein [Clostridia bacterium]
MREILFRVWNGANYEYNVMVGKFGAFYVNPMNDGLDAGDSASLSPFNTKFSDDVVIEQFTGLLDKHGRKIFEGDIVVTCPSPLSISDGCDISKRLVVDSWVFTNMCHSAMCKKSSKQEKFYKIVGNIHDNPELLK